MKTKPEIIYTVHPNPMDIQRELMVSRKQIKQKHNRINRAMGRGRSRRMANDSFMETLRDIGHCLIQGLVISCIAGAVYAGFSKSDKTQRKITKFAGAYYYPYAAQHNMTNTFYMNMGLIMCSALAAYGIRRNRPAEVNTTKRLKATEQDLNRQEHVKLIAYASNIDCAGLDNMYAEMTDADYQSEVLRMARGLAYQDADYINKFLAHTGVIKNKQIATEIIRGHLARRPNDITKLKPILTTKYLPKDIKQLYTEYNAARGHIAKFATGMRIKKQMRD